MDAKTNETGAAGGGQVDAVVICLVLLFFLLQGCCPHTPEIFPLYTQGQVNELKGELEFQRRSSQMTEEFKDCEINMYRKLLGHSHMVKTGCGY